MVAEQDSLRLFFVDCCSLAKISMVAEPVRRATSRPARCSLAKISMVAELLMNLIVCSICCSLAKISMVAEQPNE